MVRADILSKVGTVWRLRPHMKQSLETLHGVEVSFPDVADTKATVMALVSRGVHMALIVPKWEGQPWWHVVATQATLHPLPSMEMVVYPNSYGTHAGGG